MKRILFLFFILLQIAVSLNAQTSSRKGWWKFDNSANPLAAETGYGLPLTLTGTHQVIEGPAAGNGAVKIGVGSHYKMKHGIAPNGGGAHVNDYTLQIDFRVPQLTGWHCTHQTDILNITDAELFIKSTGNVGVGSTGYSTRTINANEWYRMIISVKNGVQYKYYLDGQLWLDGGAQAVESRFALDSLLLMFADDDGEDSEIDCAEIAIWDHFLSPEEIFSLGGFHNIDTTAPAPVSSLIASQNQFRNLITWTDVAGETGEEYIVYYSERPITNVAGAEILKTAIPENVQSAEHILRSPNTNQNLTYYYAIVCKDYSGNLSQPYYLNTPTVNTAKGVPTISKTAPVNFVADGNLTEWSSVPQIKIIHSEGTGFTAPNGSFSGDNDINVTARIAFDANYMYFAADVNDDIYSWTNRPDPWMNDCVDLFIGFFDARNTYFTSYRRGATPHYVFRFDEKKVTVSSSDSLLFPGQNYYFAQKFPTGYILEAKIPLYDIARKRNFGYTGITDSIFHPAEGMRIPIDFSINDADATGNRELVFTYSPMNDDLSWQQPTRWLWTWIGNSMSTGVEDGLLANNFSLEQNYPNPFNPATTISYSLSTAEFVTLKVYDFLGNEVACLAKEFQQAGKHSLKFNAAGLASGMYVYRLEAGTHKSSRKFLLLK